MRKTILYTGAGISLSPETGDGRRVSAYVRLDAEDGMGITNGASITTSINVKAVEAASWKDCDAPSAEASDIPAEDALSIITGGVATINEEIG